MSQPMNWAQNYNPLGNVFVSTLVASLPVVALLCLLWFLGVAVWLGVEARRRA